MILGLSTANEDGQDARDVQGERIPDRQGVRWRMSVERT